VVGRSGIDRVLTCGGLPLPPLDLAALDLADYQRCEQGTRCPEQDPGYRIGQPVGA
jgi:hypothetical protein